MIIHLQEDMSGLHNIIDIMSLRRDGPLTSRPGPEREENKDKPKSNHLISVEYLQSAALEAQRTLPTEDGPIWPQPGVGRPLGVVTPHWHRLA